MGVGKLIERRIQVSFNFQATRSRNSPDQPRDSGSQTQIVEHGRPQQHGDITHYAQRLLDDTHRMPNPRRKLAPRIAAGPRHARQLHAQARKHLAHLVVQFA